MTTDYKRIRIFVNIFIISVLLPSISSQYYEDDPKEYVEPDEYSSRASYGRSLSDLRLKREEIVHKNYGESCTSSFDCSSIAQLDCLNNECQCRFPEDTAYDFEANRCELLVGAKCNLIQRCTANSECSSDSSSDDGSAVCRCALDYVATSNRTCEIAEIIPYINSEPINPYNFNPQPKIINIDQETQSDMNPASDTTFNEKSALKIEPFEILQPQQAITLRPQVEIKNIPVQKDMIKLRLNKIEPASTTPVYYDDIVTDAYNLDENFDKQQEVPINVDSSSPVIQQDVKLVSNITNIVHSKENATVSTDLTTQLKLNDECKINGSEKCPLNSTCVNQKTITTMICKCNQGFVSNIQNSACLSSLLSIEITKKNNSVEQITEVVTTTTNPMSTVSTSTTKPNYPIGSKVNEPCLIDPNPDHPEILQCIKNAMCIKVPGYFKEYGTCHCKDGYFKTVKQLCRKHPVSSASKFGSWVFVPIGMVMYFGIY